MDKELIYIGSVNKALKARDTLKRLGIEARVERNLNSSKGGCGYSVLIISGNTTSAKEILFREGLLK